MSCLPNLKKKKSSLMKKSLRAEELAELLGATLEGDKDICLSGVNDLLHAGKEDISFFANARYHKEMLESQAGAIIIAPDTQRESLRTYFVHPDPSSAFQKAMALFLGQQTLTGFTGIHPTAVIHETAFLEKDVAVGPYAVIDMGVRVGKGSYIGSHVCVGPRCQLGEECVIHPHAVLREDCVLGCHVIVQPGAVIGSCGFGYSRDMEGKHTKLDQVGNVVLQDNVEVGANTTIDRARFKSTAIGEGTKIDNLVQIGHNVEIGRHSLIIAQVGIAGSTKIGNHVILAGKVAINGHIEIADGVRVAACSGVSKSIKTAGDFGGVPAMALAEYNKYAVYLRRIGELFQRVKDLEALCPKEKKPA